MRIVSPRLSSYPALFWLVLLASSLPLPGQTAAAPAPPPPDASQLSPRAAYQDALHPLDITRHNVSNWSDIEVAALHLAMAQAKAACDARTPATYTGADLLDLAHLCALGQQWAAVNEAAGLYISEPASPKPLLPDAYAAKIDAELQLKDSAPALADSFTLLKTVPYTAEVADAINEALLYFRFVPSSEALRLAAARQPLLLAALRSTANPTTQTIPTNPTATPQAPAPGMPTHKLYSDGLQWAILQQLAAQPDAAAATVLALDAALPHQLAPDDALPIAGERRRYALLGKPLRGIAPLGSLRSPRGKLPDVPAHRTITALLLFPDWCAACIRMGLQFPETVFTVEGHGAYLYGLLARTVPPRQPAAEAIHRPDPAFATAQLTGTPTLTVAPDTLERFAAADFPFLILTDSNGIVRVLQPVEATDLQPGGTIDAAIALVGRNFPTQLPEAVAVSPPSARP